MPYTPPLLADDDGLSALAPFHPPRHQRARTPLAVEGRVPAWLRGDLLRTCPAVFEVGAWRARHLFDGLCMLYGFEIDGSGVHYKNRLLATQQRARIEAGSGWSAMWGDGPQRSWLRRIAQPVPPTTDNANVNLGRIGDDFVAMTETPHQVRFDPTTLQTLGPKVYDDDLPSAASLIAHPRLDVRRRTIVSVASELSARPALSLYTVDADSRRVPFARKASPELPYVHDFGLTDDYALLVMHPYTVRPTHLLWSNRGIGDHMRWDPQRSTSIAVVDRRDGSWRELEVPGGPFFVFHVANAFARDDGELVLDALTYPDASIVGSLAVDAIAAEGLAIEARFERIRIDLRAGRCHREPIGDAAFELPTIDYRRRHGRPYRFCWGAHVRAHDGQWHGEVVKLDLEHGATSHYVRPGYNLGEPIFVPRDKADDSAAGEDDGVLLTVASDLVHDRAELVILDARTLSPVASAEVDDAIPLGFHGQFFSK